MQSLVESHVFRESYRESMRLVLSKWWSSSLQRFRFLLEGRQVVPIAHFRPITALVGHVVSECFILVSKAFASALRVSVRVNTMHARRERFVHTGSST